MTTLTFSALGVAEPIQRALAAESYFEPTPIQARAIPLILSGRDVVGVAQTGTGKTAAFGLPLLQRLASERQRAEPHAVRALILAPTRELAIQIHDSLGRYGRHLGLRLAVIVGGVNQNRQIGAAKRGLDILVATPGRLLDLVAQEHLRLDAVSTLVIDEADRMFDMGFIRDVRRIVSHLPRRRQSLLFSATMPASVAHFVAEILHDAARIDVSPASVTADGIDQRVYFVAEQEKRGLLLDLLGDAAMKRVIVFTRTKHHANKVAAVLDRAGHRTDAIHGNKSQNARQRALEGFRAGHSRILVATDIAARGIDIDDVSHIVNLDIPAVAENYIHRIGRTARAGSGGTAISFCDPSERHSLRAIERLVNRPLAVAHGERRPPEPRPVAKHSHGRSADRSRDGKKFRGRPPSRAAASTSGKERGSRR